MSKAMRVVVATSLAVLVYAPAWAGEAEAHESMGDNPQGNVTVAKAATVPQGNVDFLTFDEPVTAGSSEGVVEADAGSSRPVASSDVRASYEDARWLREREGFRDGGY